MQTKGRTKDEIKKMSDDQDPKGEKDKGDKFSTRAIHEGLGFRENTGAIIPPMYLTSTFQHGNVEGFDYTRSGNPNFQNLEKILSSLEDAEYATVFSSGVAAITAVISSLKTGDLVIAEEVIYGCTFRLFDQVFTKYGLKIDYYDLTKKSNFKRILELKPAVIWIETPTNPLLNILDIQAIAEGSKSAGSLLVVDDTFASSYFQQPLSLGADLALSSTTKYSNGHSDCLGGVICTNNSVWHEKMVFAQKALGLNPSPFDSWLITRGLKTLSLRMECHEKNALELAKFLEMRPEVKYVRYPFLPSHPQFELAKKQMRGGSGIVTAELNLDKIKVMKFMESLNCFMVAESLGGIESLMCHPATMTHASVPEEQRLAIGITDSLVRFSVGIEHLDDLIRDISNAFDSVKS